MKMLPKWIIGENVDCNRDFIMHTEYPRFIAEIFDSDDGTYNIIGAPKGEVIFIDEPEPDVTAIAKLMREAGDALAMYDEVNETKAEIAKIEEEQDEW